MNEVGKAILMKIESLPEQARSYFIAQAYTYALDPPTTWKGVPYQATEPQVIALDTITVAVRRGETQIHAHGSRLRCFGRMNDVIMPDEALRAFCGYEEAVLSKIQRALQIMKAHDLPPSFATYLPGTLIEIWPQLSDETRLIATAVMQESNAAVEAAKKRSSWEDMPDEWGGDEATEEEKGRWDAWLHELRSIRRLLEERL